MLKKDCVVIESILCDPLKLDWIAVLGGVGRFLPSSSDPCQEDYAVFLSLQCGVWDTANLQ